MANMPKGSLTKREAYKRLHGVDRVPQFAAVVAVDGVPYHIALFTDSEQALEWATANDVFTLYRPLADTHHVRMTLGQVVDSQPEDGLPSWVHSITNQFHTWEVGTRSEDVAKTPGLFAAADAKKKATTAKKAAPKTTVKKPTTKKPAPKTTAKKPTTKAAPRSGGAGPKKTTAKKPVAKTAGRRTTKRR